MAGPESLPTRRDGLSGAASDLELVNRRYRPIRILGSGGMGAVFLAYDVELKRKVAIKRMAVESEAGQQLLAREARALAKLSHPNVVGVFEIEESADGSLSIVMEFVEGMTLDQWLVEQEPDWRRTIEVFLDAGRGLVAAHELGIVHRDFKLSNVMIGAGGRVRVIDFGLARASKDAGSDVGLPSVTTTSGKRIVMGTPGYMSPEQHMGAELDARADQYSYCVALFRALYRRFPFEGETRRKLFEAKLDNELCPAPEPSEVPPSVYRLLARGLRSAPEERWATLDELLQRLASAVEVRPTRRRVAQVAGVLVVGLVLGLGLRALQGDPCRDVSSLDGVWDPARRAAVEAALPTGEASAFALDGIDVMAAQWSSSSRTLCERNELAEPSAAARHSRACLDARRAELVALGDLLAQGGAELAAPTVAGLPAPEDCLRPPNEPTRAVFSDRRFVERLARVEIAAELGRAEALVRARALLDEASAGQDPATVARAAYVLGRAAWAGREREEAATSFEDAFWAAADASEHALTVESATALVLLHGAKKDRAKVEHWYDLARAALGRLGEDMRLTGALAHAHADALVALGESDEAVAEYDRALEAYGRSIGIEHPWARTCRRRVGQLAGEVGAGTQGPAALASAGPQPPALELASAP